jgi:hypothetical protein
MRPPVLKEAHRSHLQPCPRCGEANGITAIACWKCDLQLMPEHLLEPREGPDSRLPPPEEVPRVEAEVPAEMLEQLRVARHDDAHTLPPLAAAMRHDTANDPYFGAAWASPQFRLLWVAVGVALAAALLAWLVPRAPVEVVRTPAKVSSTVKLPPPAAQEEMPPVTAVPAPTVEQRQAAAPVAEPVAAVQAVPPAVLPPTAARGAVVRARPADSRSADPSRPAEGRWVAPRAQSAPARAAPRDDESTRRVEEAVRRADADSARGPAPVQAPCTQQVAALGLCDSKQ